MAESNYSVNEACVVLNTESETESECSISSLPSTKILKTPPHMMPKDRFNRHNLRSPPFDRCLKRRREDDWMQSEPRRRRCEVTSRDSGVTSRDSELMSRNRDGTSCDRQVTSSDSEETYTCSSENEDDWMQSESKRWSYDVISRDSGVTSRYSELTSRYSELTSRNREETSCDREVTSCDREVTSREREVKSRDSEETYTCCSGSFSRNPSSLQVDYKRESRWMIGMSCRAIYKEDGLEYEAFVVRILNEQECIVKFLGYETTQQVYMNTLTPSLGEESQQLQIEEAFVERAQNNASEMQVADEMQTGQTQYCTNTERLYLRRDPRIIRRLQATNFDQPQMPSPYMDNQRNMAFPNISSTIPPPPLPPMHLLPPSSSEKKENAFSNMLLAWYMSGYYTALYRDLDKSNASQ